MMRTLTILLLMLIFTPAVMAESEPRDVAAQIDQILEEAWDKEKIVPARTVDDFAYLRRVTLDLAGRLPTTLEQENFSEDSSAAKRTLAIKRLVGSDAYADRWAEYWYNVLMGRLTHEAFIDRHAFRAWLKQEFSKNSSWGKIATQLVSSEGINTDRRPKGAKSDPQDWDERFQPATNWFLRYYRSLPDYSGAVAKNLLGVQIQCAQCHDHHTESWTQKDFVQFTAFFARTWPSYHDRTLVVGTLRLDTKDRRIDAPVTGRYKKFFASYEPYVGQNPKLLGVTGEIGRFEPRRKRFAEWMTSAQNPWFGQAFVNRIWHELLGTGFVEPIDDFRPSNPAVLPDVLSLLAADFVKHEYDIQRLLTIICLTKAYDRESIPSNPHPVQHSLWSSYPIKSLEIETYYDIVIQATEAEKYLDRLTRGKPNLLRDAFIRQFIADLGTDEMTESAEFGETIPRALMQLNGPLTTGLTRNVPGLTLSKILRKGSHKERIQSLYRKTLCRDPSSEELSNWTRFITSRKEIANSQGPPSRIPTGIAARKISPGIMNADSSKEFRELLKEAKTGADFRMLAGKMKNNADGGLYVKAFEAWMAEAPFQYLSNAGGGSTPEEQAYEDFFWALLCSSEFLCNH